MNYYQYRTRGCSGFDWHCYAIDCEPSADLLNRHKKLNAKNFLQKLKDAFIVRGKSVYITDNDF